MSHEDKNAFNIIELPKKTFGFKNNYKFFITKERHLQISAPVMLKSWKKNTYEGFVIASLLFATRKNKVRDQS